MWLLEPSILQAMLAARRDASHLVTARAHEYMLEVEARGDARDGQLPRNMTIAGSTAEVRVEGVLTKRPDFWAIFLGGGNTTYSSIRASLSHAETNASIKEVILHVDSPGGAADGLIDTLDAISTFRSNSGKKIRVRAENAQSAAYGIAAAAGSIEAVGRGATFGSIGTAVAYYHDENIIELTNTDSPDKRPDLTTDEGKAVVIKFLDQLNEEFVRSIAQGRGVEMKDVLENYGRGASMTAVHAKRLGMIDRIASTTPRAVPNKKEKAMAEEFAEDRGADIDAAVQRGIDQERDRVLAHLTMGEACGDVSIALDAIKSGAGMTLELNARYLSAGMNRSDRQKRQTESNAAEKVLSGVDATSAAAPDLGDQVVAILKNQKGNHIHA